MDRAKAPDTVVSALPSPLYPKAETVGFTGRSHNLPAKYLIF